MYILVIVSEWTETFIVILPYTGHTGVYSRFGGDRDAKSETMNTLINRQLHKGCDIYCSVSQDTST